MRCFVGVTSPPVLRTDPSPGRAFGAERGEQIGRLRGGHAEKTVVFRFRRSLCALRRVNKLVNLPTSNAAAALCIVARKHKTKSSSVPLAQ